MVQACCDVGHARRTLRKAVEQRETNYKPHTLPRTKDHASRHMAAQILKHFITTPRSSLHTRAFVYSRRSPPPTSLPNTHEAKMVPFSAIDVARLLVLEERERPEFRDSWYMYIPNLHHISEAAIATSVFELSRKSKNSCCLDTYLVAKHRGPGDASAANS